MGRIRRMSLGDAMAMFPGFTPVQLGCGLGAGKRRLSGALDRGEAQARQRHTVQYDDSCEVTIVQIQWIERETFTGSLPTRRPTQSRPKRQAGAVQGFSPIAHGGAGHAGSTCRRRAWCARSTSRPFSAPVMLKKAGPAPIPGQFTWKCITGEFDKLVKGTWFGLVRILRDPQMWANKWLSQILHILNTTAKGGILLSAMRSMMSARLRMAMRRPIASPGRRMARCRRQAKDHPQARHALTDGYVGLLAFAISSFKDVSGINLELLGQQDQNQPGILEAMRKQAGMTVLATLFDALRNFRKQVGKTRGCSSSRISSRMGA
jgi:hypothetical protein